MEQIVDRLTEIKKQGLYRDLKYLSAPQCPHTVIDGRKVLLMASNSYLGLCNDERLKAAAIKALQEYGVGSGGSRLTTGSYRLHQELEQASEGGYVAGKQCLIDYLRNRARSFIFTTALAPATVAVALAALEIVEQEPEPRKVLLENAQWLCTRLKEAGFKILENKTPIIPIIIGEAEKALQFSQALLEEGIYIPAIRPPTVPPGTSRLRLTLMATHTREDLNYALAKIIQVARELTIIKP